MTSTDTHDATLRLRAEDAPGACALRGAWLVAFVLAALVFVALRLWRLTGSCLWFDEIFGVHAARHEWGAMLKFVAQDLIHPPLFYALVKGWTMLGGESLAWLRLLPALISVATIAPFYLLCRELRLRHAETTLALVLMSLNGYLIKYAQELRMYSLLLFFACCSLWLFVRYCNARGTRLRRDAAALFVVNLLLVYTHYYGWLVVATQFVFLLFYGARRKRLAFALTTALALACFGFWAYAVARAHAADVSGNGFRQNVGWMSRPTPVAVAGFYLTLNEILYYPQSSDEPLFSRWSAPLGLLLFCAPLGLLLRQALRRRDTHAAAQEPAATTREGLNAGALRFLLLFSALPVALAFVASWLLPASVWGARHLIIVAPAYLILVAIAINALRPVTLRNAALVLLACWTLVSVAFVGARSDGRYIWCAWDELARRAFADGRTTEARTEAGRQRAATVKVYTFEDLSAYHTWFALSSMKSEGVRVEVVKGIEGLLEDPAYFLPRGFDEVATANAAQAFREEHFWIAFRDTTWRPEKQPLKLLRERGYETGQGFEFSAQGHKAFLVPVHRRSNN